MAGGKLSPRQKMINMMYLVLTALLAMNVSKEILNAFKVVNKSIDKSNSLIDDKNVKVLKIIEKERKNQPEKVEELMGIAGKVQAKSDDLIKFLDTQISTLNKASDKDDDLDVAAHNMVEKKKGVELLQKLTSYKKDVEALMVKYPVEIPLDLAIPKTENEENSRKWETAYFGGVPKIAAITILSKFKNDIKSAEALVFDRLSKEASSVDVVLDKFEPIISSKSSYILVGDKYEAMIGIGAFNTAIVPEIFVNGRQLPIKDGKAIFEQVGSSAGTVKLKTLVKIPKRTAGEFEVSEGTLEYTVGVPAGAAVMLDKMNVIYIGVDNPLTVSSGSGDEKTRVNITGGGSSLQKVGPGKYIAKATTVGKANMTVGVEGAKAPAKEFELRVKRIPDPIPTLGGKLRGGNAPAGTIKAQSGVVAALENFDFDAKFKVKSFTMIYVPRGADPAREETQGPAFNDKMLGFLSRAKAKDIFIIDDIRAIGPDGTTRALGQIAFTII